MPTSAWNILRERMAELRALQGAITVLAWDQETYMPAGGASARGEQLAALQGVLHERFSAGALADALAGAEASLRGGEAPDGAPDDALAVLRAMRFDRDRAVKVPARLVRELAELQSAALVAWRTAREENDFGRFAPFLEGLLALRREQAQAFGVPEGGEVYDALLEGYEPGMRVARLEPLFARLTGWLAPLVERLTSAPPPTSPFAAGRFDVDAQWALSLEVLDLMGFDRRKGRLDQSIHPFTLAPDPGDVRLTTHLYEDLPLYSVFITLHEGGHGLFEQGLPSAHRRDPLGMVVSMGLHESQSRLWENQVGRSLPFWRGFAPRMAARFPQLAGLSAEALYRAANRVARTPVRGQADEVTYNLHIALRFELELGMLRGSLRVRDIPGAWNDGLRRLLGLGPVSDAQGALQDIHWASGDLGYFPTYTLGNLYAAQLFAAAQHDLSGLDGDLAAGRFLGLRDWLREKVHRHGRALPAEEIVRRATGRGLDDEAFHAHLEAKYLLAPAACLAATGGKAAPLTE